MHTVVETPAFLSSARKAGMTEAERAAAVDLISANPDAGDVIVGSGGCRKIRVSGRGKGKAGGYRVVTYYADERTLVFLITALSKGSDANFSNAQVKAMKVVAAVIVQSLGPRAEGQ